MVNGRSGNQEITLDSNGQAQLHVSQVASALNGANRHVPLEIAGERITVSLYEQAIAIRLLSPVLEVRSLHLEEVKELLSQDILSQSAFAPQIRLVAEVLQGSTADWAKAQALFDIFTSLPEGRHLAPHRQAVSVFLQTRAPADFTQAYIQELSASINKRQSADLSYSYRRMLGLLVMAEMMAAKPSSMEHVTNSVRDVQDIRVWLDWMAMPANGWALYQPPVPDVQQSCTDGVQYIEQGAAKLPINPCRLTGEQFGFWLDDFSTILPEFSSNPALMREQLETIYSGLANSNYDLRTSLFATGEPVAYWDPTSPFVQRANAAAPAVLALAPLVMRMVVRLTAKLAVKLGKNAAKNLAKFALGKSNSRIHPMIFLLSAGYLYDEIESGRLKTGKSDASSKFWSTIGLFVGRLALENGRDGVIDIEETLQENGGYNCRMFNFSHGNMYEIVMIAFYQAMGRKIVELDRPVKVELYGGHMLTRKPDIELEGDGEKSIWVELKSVQAGPSYQGNDNQLPTKETFLNRFAVFNAQQRLATKAADAEEKRSGSNEYHKQFVLDRLAVYGFKDGESASIAKQMHWRFQKWKPKLIRYKAKVAGRNAAGNGYPLATGVRGSSGKYLDLLKERFAEIPIQRADFQDRLDLDFDGVTQRQFETVQIRLIFSDPAVSELLDGQDDLDEYFLQHVLTKMGYSVDELDKLKRYMDGLDAIQQRLEVVTSWWDRVKSALHLDVEDELLEVIQEKGEELAVNVGLGGSCEVTY